jgi:hypothetical protein
MPLTPTTLLQHAGKFDVDGLAVAGQYD